MKDGHEQTIIDRDHKSDVSAFRRRDTRVGRVSVAREGDIQRRMCEQRTRESLKQKVVD